MPLGNLIASKPRAEEQDYLFVGGTSKLGASPNKNQPDQQTKDKKLLDHNPKKKCIGGGLNRTRGVFSVSRKVRFDNDIASKTTYGKTLSLVGSKAPTT